MWGLRERETSLDEVKGFESPGFWDCRRDKWFPFPIEELRDGRARDALGPAYHGVGIIREDRQWEAAEFTGRSLRPRMDMLSSRLPAPAMRNTYVPGDIVLFGNQPEGVVIGFLPELGIKTRDTTANELCGMSIGFTGEKHPLYMFGYAVDRVWPAEELSGGGYIALRPLILFMDEHSRGFAPWDLGFDAILLSKVQIWTREYLAKCLHFCDFRPSQDVQAFCEFITENLAYRYTANFPDTGVDPIFKTTRFGKEARVWVYLPGTRAFGVRLKLALAKFFSDSALDIVLDFVKSFANDLLEQNVFDKIKTQADPKDWEASAQKAAKDLGEKLKNQLLGTDDGKSGFPGKDALMEMFLAGESFTPEMYAKIAAAIAANILIQLNPFTGLITGEIGKIAQQLAQKIITKGDVPKTIGDKLKGILDNQLGSLPGLLFKALGDLTTEPRK